MSCDCQLIIKENDDDDDDDDGIDDCRYNVVHLQPTAVHQLSVSGRKLDDRRARTERRQKSDRR